MLGLNDPPLKFFGLIVSFPNSYYWSDGMFFKEEFNPTPLTIIDPFLESLRRLWTGVEALILSDLSFYFATFGSTGVENTRWL